MVVKAILLDRNARNIQHANKTHFGRLKDPLQRVAHTIKAFDCTGGKNLATNAYPGLQWWRPAPIEEILQEPLRAPSVFNFYDATYRAPGTISERNLNSPEFQILNDVTSIKIINYLWTGINGSFHIPRSKIIDPSMSCDFKKAEEYLATGHDELLDYLNLMLTSGASIDNALRNGPRKLDSFLSAFQTKQPS